ncbi:hypothetical protein INT45_007576 [Circinella minor]|uniref:Uncharacterized protein n=1 Tax=Circinella minor TaxID=1195481 RepID=A0A8H7VIT8_9FUNG|nr:hypothetical protein INT45_007576 [Circinella minor]
MTSRNERSSSSSSSSSHYYPEDLLHTNSNAITMRNGNGNSNNNNDDQNNNTHNHTLSANGLINTTTASSNTITNGSNGTNNSNNNNNSSNNNNNNNSNKQPLFELVNVHNRITLDNVYQNGLHALKRLEIRNLTDQRILVKMRSNLRNQIAFQLDNENLHNLPVNVIDTITTTNTVEWARNDASNEFHFNQLFNYVNHIDYLELAPQESRPFILAFLPETNRRTKEDILTRGNNDDDNDDVNDSSEAGRRFSLHDLAAEEGNMYETFNVTGSLFFFGYYVDDESASTTTTTTTTTQQQQQEQETTSASTATSTPALYQLSVKFRASVCQSVMWTDVAETGVNFDDCMLGEECYRDFTIQNNSEVELHWLVNTVDLSNLNREGWLQFSDAETGKKLLDYEPIPGHSHRRVRLTFMPKEVGEFNYDLQIENANDARNVVQTKVHASVRSILRQESLIISSGNVIDFGDCISGTWTMRQIVLNNVGESPVEVRFIPETADVVFDIKTALEPGTAASTSQQQQNGGKTKEQQQQSDQEFPGRLIGGKRQLESEKGSSSAITTTPTGASISEVSAPNSEVSSRASSPTSSRNMSRTVEYESSPSPTSQESYGNTNSISTTGAGTRIQTPTDNVYDSSTTDESASRLIELSRDRASTPTLNSGGSYTRIEDLVLRPGKERVIQVSYRPRKDSSINDFNAGQLIRRNFRIVLEYGCDRSGAEPKERKAIQCKTRTCTSFVEAIPKSINFGDTDVGTLKSLPINIFNRSDIIARVELQFSSKVLNCLRGEIVIQPRSYVELKLDLYPRKVNPEYRKQITLVNYLNRDNDQIIEVQSTNIDKNRVTFHSLFYRILTTTGANFLDFGSIVLNSPSIRTFTVENIRSAPLTLEVTTSLPDDITVFVKKKRSDQQSTKIVKPIATTSQQNISTVKKEMGKSTLANLDRNIATGVSVPRPIQTTMSKNNNGLQPSPIHRGQSSATATPSTAIAADSYSTAYLDLATTPLRHSTALRRKQVLLKNSTKPILTQASHISRIIKHHRVSDLAERNSSKHNKNRGSSKESRNTSPKNSKSNGLKKRSPQREDSFDGEGVKSKRSMGITAARYKSRKNLDWADIAGKSRVPFEDLISVLEHGSKAATPLFPKQSAEERFVRQQLAWRRELDRLIEKGDLVRSSTIEVAPHGEEEVVIVFTPNGETKPHVQSAPKKQDARIFLRLISFDRNIEQEEFTSLLYGDQSTIPVREVIVRAQLCRSIMDLGQKNINFGLVERNERHAKSIVLHNRSETPLLYAIRKSGSIASGDIILGAGRYGVVRAFGKREIEFVFEPTLAGHFMERLIVENIRDRTNDRVLLLKAMVRKPSTFFIKSLELNFGPCLVDQTCQRVQTIVFTNTNKQTRLFEIRVDPNEANFGRTYGEFDFVVEDDESSQLSKEAEEEIENLEQKLKIARRKKQTDKEKKYLKKLAKLRNQDVPEEEEDGREGGEEESKKKEKNKEKKKKDKEANGTGPTTGVDDQGASSNKKPSATNEETIKENSNVFKKTPESVVFPLDPNATKTISVRFKAITRPIQIDNNTPVEHIQQVRGQIMAHEYKNTDTNKMISYTATLCEDQAAYKEALANESSDKQIGSSAAPGAEATDDNIVVIESVSAETRANRTDPMMNDQPEPLKLERSVFDGGRVEVNQKSTFYVRVSNDSDEPLEYEFLLDTNEKDFFICPETTTPLAPKEIRKLMFEILPTSVGKQEHTICIRNCHTNVMQTFTLECLVHYKSYLAFPSLSEGNQGELDLGFSYVDPGTKYSQVTPLLVENVSGQDLFITCQSNLSHQVLIFVDEAGERGLVEMMPFKRGCMTTVWVAVQPNLLTGYLGSSSADECRELVGGIKFSIYTEDDQALSTIETAVVQERAEGAEEGGQERKSGDENNNDRLVLMLTQTVKFISIIGQSHLEVSHRKINLGYTDKLGAEFYGAFTIKNKSGQLPLDYEVECPSRNIVLDRRGGTLNGWRGIVASNESALDYLDQKEQQQQQHRDQRKEEQVEQLNDVTNTQTVMSVAQITFRIHAYRYGLLSEKLIVTNKHNSQEVFEIEVRFFVKQHNVEAWMVQGNEQQLLLCDTTDDNGEGLDDEHHKEANPLPLVQWESVYVCPATNHSKSMPPALQVMMLSDQDEARLYVREIEVANVSDQPMQLIALSDIDITAGWVADEDKVRTAYVVEEGAYLQRSGQLILDPKQRVRVRLQCPSPEKLTDHDRAQALQGKSGILAGMFILYDMQQQVEVLALELKALFCVSVAELAVDRIDLGQIGHVASWKPVKFSFTIRNMADVPLNYDIIHPDFMSFVPKEQNTQIINRSNVSNVTTFNVEPRKNQIVQGTLDPRQLRDQSSGQRRFDIRLDNNYNQNNTMTLKLRALMTAFELEFERLSNNEELVLPPLYHPIAATNISCDSWFVVHNTTDDDIRFEIGADISPGLEEYLKIDVLSRYTNTPLRGGISVSPQGRMEVRVRATPNGRTRLPHDRPDLLDPEGIILANLWVTTRPMDMGNAEENRKLREMIPIRSTLIETPIFTLSERRLDFELVTYYQEEDDQGSSSSLSPSTSPSQLSSTIATATTPTATEESAYETTASSSSFSTKSNINKVVKEDNMNNDEDLEVVCRPDSHPLTILNHATKLPLRYKVTIEGAAEFPAQDMVQITPLSSDGIGVVEADSTVTLNVRIANPKDSIPGQIRIQVDDLDAVGLIRQTASIFIKETVWDL